MAGSRRFPERTCVLVFLGLCGSARAEAPKETTAVRVGGFVQADSILSRESSLDEVDGSTGAPLNQTRFLIRRSRIRLEIERSWVFGKIELDANTVNGMSTGLTETYVGARAAGRFEGDDVSARALLGLTKIPFGFEGPELDTVRLFLERTNASRALFPGTYDLGGRADGRYGPLGLSVAVMNGNPTADHSFPARDPDAAKDLVGRLGVDTGEGGRTRFRGGISALSGTGFHPGTPSTKDTLVWRDANENGRVEQTELLAIAGTAATRSRAFDRFAMGADARFSVTLPVVGEFVLFGEIVWAKNLDRALVPADPIALGRDSRELGFHVGFLQEVTRHGMIGIRYDRYDPDLDASEQRGVSVVPKDPSYSTLAFAAALRGDGGRLILEYDKNDNPLGRTKSGAPTTLADDQIALRGEVVF